MKSVIKYLAVATLPLMMASCNLDKEPETTMTDASFWKSETDLRGACNRFYQQLNGSNALCGGFFHDYRSDELTTGGANNISDGSWTVPSTNGAWTDCYWRIFISNNIIKKAPRANVSEDVLNRYLAEARFFRAFYYFELVKKYGDVPLLLIAIDSTDAPELSMGRTPREEVIAQVYDDLEFAEQWLPDIDSSQITDNWGHVSRQAATAMIVRVGLYEGTWGKFHNLSGCDVNAHLQKSIKAAESLISGGKFGLYPDFEKLFQLDGEGRQNKENVFVKVYGPNESSTTSHNNSRQLENSCKLTRNMVDLFLYTDGLPREKSPLCIRQETSMADIFTDRDPRLAMTIYQYGEEAYKGPLTCFAFGTGYDIKKGFDLVQWSTNGKEYTDKMLIRYAEVLISYAEALYEANGSISDQNLDLTVNALRRRAGMPAMLTNAFASANGLDIREEIRRERTIEFIDENKRYDDIIRWKIAENVLPASIIGQKFNEDETTRKAEEYAGHLTDENGMINGVKYYDQPNIYVIEFAKDRRFDPNKDYLYPVPLYEISKSGGNVTQNPGWE